jgi:ABC-type lipoprotein export system ATPase subunit
VIRITDLEKRYPADDRRVLAGARVVIGAGEIASLVGRSGCGKTTLLNIVGGLDTKYSGNVEIDGRDLRELDDVELAHYRRRRVGVVFQAYHLLDHLSCAENVAISALFGRSGSTSTPRARRRRADEVLELVGLAGVGDLRPHRLSGGERQRVAIARALFNRPALLLLDEPTGNLDATTGGEILELLGALHGAGGLTVLAATHDPTIVAAGSRRLVMTDGLIVDDPRGRP